MLALWYFGTRGESASFILATPQEVVTQFGLMLTKGTLVHHTLVTLAEVGIGFSLGVSVALILGYGIASSHLLESVVGPYAVGFQGVPLIVIAPVLIRILGPGLLTNGIISALIVFFPMLINTAVAIRNIDPTLRDLMQSLSATRWQTFVKLEAPAALPVLFGGLKVSIILSFIGAIVAEMASPNAGLGFLIYSSQYLYSIAGALVGVFTVTMLTLAFYGIFTRIERRLLAWRRVND